MTDGNMRATTTKIHRVGDLLVGFAGPTYQGEHMLEWIRSGRNPDTLPEAQKDGDTSASVIVIERGSILLYDRGPYPLRIKGKRYAIGSGCEYAVAAMYLGCNAYQAVAVACKFDTLCGMGIDTLAVNAKPARKRP